MLLIKMLLNLGYFKPVKYTYPNDIMHEISNEDDVLPVLVYYNISIQHTKRNNSGLAKDVRVMTRH